MLCRRTAALCTTFKQLSSSKAVLSVNSQCGFLLQIASYNPKPLKLNLRNPYIPDKDSEKTPEWQKTARYDRKLFGRYGSASGVDPASLWPTHEQLEKIIAEENEWHPPLEVMLKNIEAREKEESDKRLAKALCRGQLSATSLKTLATILGSYPILFFFSCCIT
uniref:Large ribosomal subunit protein mL64 n=1 Tax=Amphilophus citrinellus TaxID=61819 RepID=A0A3Q0RR60_AMPCI